MVAFAMLALAVLILTTHGNALINEIDLSARFSPPSLDHPFGTERFGRDVVLLTMAGLASSFILALLAMAVAVLLGSLIGFLWWFCQSGPIGLAFRTLNGSLLSIPPLLLIAAFLLVSEGQRYAVAALVGFVFAPYLARIVYRELGRTVSRDFFLIERLFGISYFDSLMKIGLPKALQATLPAIIVLTADIVALDVALSFLGFSLRPVEPSLGDLIRQGFQDMQRGWWISIGPSILMAIVIIDLNWFSFTLLRRFQIVLDS